jgi:hypothetical protein
VAGIRMALDITVTRPCPAGPGQVHASWDPDRGPSIAARAGSVKRGLAKNESQYRYMVVMNSE